MWANNSKAVKSFIFVNTTPTPVSREWERSKANAYSLRWHGTAGFYIYPPSMSFRSNWLSFTNQKLIYLFIFYLFSSSHQLHSCKYSGSRHHAENSKHPAVCFDFDSITRNRRSTCRTQLAGPQAGNTVRGPSQQPSSLGSLICPENCHHCH